ALWADCPALLVLGLARRNSLRALWALRSDRRRDTEDEARRARRPKTALFGAAYIPPASPRLPLLQRSWCAKKNPGGVRSGLIGSAQLLGSAA
ncbi:MAG: hypothetical protein AB7L76_18155, partial [Burkholderiaceae bacterium]